MSNIVLKVENLYKEYRLGAIGHGTLRHDLGSWWARMRGKEDPNSLVDHLGSRQAISRTQADPSETELNRHLLALNDVSFEVNQGDALGIIGRNGAGKSTLLKIISRITSPSKGWVRSKGKIASLLEVGTGFHPELTGRENIFLNGAILGMSRGEIIGKMDEIVAFSELERFIDTPVKRFSSGMYVRLAFAVAAHLNADILLMDEVLAVGDAQFQAKCLGKMKSVGENGRTILFVSHNMNAVEQLCSRAVLLDKGAIRKIDNDVRAVVSANVFDAKNELFPSEWRNGGGEYENPHFQPLSFTIVDRSGQKKPMPLSNDSEMFVAVEAQIDEMVPDLCIGCAVYDERNVMLFYSLHTDTAPDQRPTLQAGRCCLRGQIPQHVLNEGTYRIELIGGIYCRRWLFEPGKNCPVIHITIQGGLSDSSYWMSKRPGILAPILPWKVV